MIQNHLKNIIMLETSPCPIMCLTTIDKYKYFYMQIIQKLYFSQRLDTAVILLLSCTGEIYQTLIYLSIYRCIFQIQWFVCSSQNTPSRAI